MKPLAVLLTLVVLAAPALAQHKRGPEGRPSAQMSNEERQRLRQDVDSARGTYGRREARPPERMPPEEREKLRRDVQDANRDLRRR